MEKYFQIDLSSHAKVVNDSLQPPGYSKALQKLVSNKSSSSSSRKESSTTLAQEQKTLALKQKRAMEIAMAPGKNLFMQAFMMYMSGSGVQIFSIMITAMALFTPLKSVLGISKAFASVAGPNVDLMQAKSTFIALNLLGFFMALYKCGTMGLLPVTSADWTFLLPIKTPLGDKLLLMTKHTFI